MLRDRRTYFVLLAALLVGAAAYYHLRPTSRSFAEERLADDGDGAQGLQVTFTTLAKDWTGGPDARSVRLASLYVPTGEPPTPFLPSGPFRAKWEGNVVLELGGLYTFSADGRGTVKVQLNGATVFDATGDEFSKTKGKEIKLKKGANQLVIEYESPAKGESVMRLFWESSDFRREPVQWSVLRHDDKAKPLADARQLREGRELLVTNRCLRCHQADTETWVKHGGMPELAMDAPSLEDIGARLTEGWMARWIQNPTALRPTATMPRVFADAETGDKAKLDGRARDIAAYLASLGKDKAKAENKLVTNEAIQSGTRLFTNLGCIGCHTPPGKDEFDEERRRIPLRDVHSKWNRPALSAFLQKPDSHYLWIRMPNFGLSEQEAYLLAVYLCSPEKRDFSLREEAGNIEKGRKLVQTSGCLNCHALKENGKPLTTELKPLAFADLKADRWGHGCTAEKVDKERKAPVFALKAEQVAAVKAFVADKRLSLTRDAAPEFAARTMKALRCQACHKRDEQDDWWTDLKDEEAGLLAGLPMLDPEKEPKQYIAPQVRPTLTWTGEKLKPEWMTALIAGQLKYKPRPYLRAKMPAFPQRAALLAEGLAFEHGCPPTSPPDPAPDEKLAEVGMQLTSKKRWGCIGCHDVGKTEAVGVFEAPGPNFMYIKERLRREYYDRWLWAPTRLEPMTKMPTVYNYGKPSPLAEILDGDSGKQIDAIWNYLLLGDKIKPPPQ